MGKQEELEEQITGVCKRGLHEYCTGNVLQFTKGRAKRLPCKCDCLHTGKGKSQEVTVPTELGSREYEGLNG